MNCTKSLLEGGDADAVLEVCPMNCRKAVEDEVSVIALRDEESKDWLFAWTNIGNDSLFQCEDDYETKTYEKYHALGAYFYFGLKSMIADARLEDRIICICLILVGWTRSMMQREVV